jgi:hypothetical protein
MLGPAGDARAESGGAAAATWLRGNSSPTARRFAWSG